MNSIRKFGISLIAVLWMGSAWAVPVYDPGGETNLDDVFDGLGLTAAGYDVVSSQDNHAYWTHSAVGSTSSYLFSDVSFGGVGDSLGVYSATSGEMIEVFGDTLGTDATTLSFKADGSVQSFSSTGSITSAITFGDVFGFYITMGGNTYYSDPSMNPSYDVDGTSYQDYMLMYQGDGTTVTNDYNGISGGLFGIDDWLIAMEALTHGAGLPKDFDDAVILVESIFPAPAPATLALLGIGLVGLGATLRKRTS